jgi:uncharacterized protein YjiS (DUF1127 family)
MSKPTFDATEHAVSNVSAAPKSGLLRRFFDALSRSRQMQADREVKHYLARQSNRTLHDIGMTDAEIADLRDTHGR